MKIHGFIELNHKMEGYREVKLIQTTYVFIIKKYNYFVIIRSNTLIYG